MVNLERGHAWIDVLFRVAGLAIIVYLAFAQAIYEKEVTPYEYLIGIAMVKGIPVEKIALLFSKKP